MNEVGNFDEIDPPGDPAVRVGEASLEAAVQREPSRIRRFLKILGPGLITGASDDDPSGIGTYAIAGAKRATRRSGPRLSPFP